MPHDPAPDVFVSYAHADNGVPLGAAMAVGWVTAFAANLNQGPNALNKRLFIDHQLKPGDNFASGLLDTVQRSATLVVLLSQNYVESDWCGDEIRHFVRTHHTDPDHPQGVFVIELFPYERLNHVPKVIADLRKRLIHAKFWLQRPDASEATLAGYPSPLESGPDGSAHYWRVLNELRAGLDQHLRRVQARRPGRAPAARHPHPALPSSPDAPVADAATGADGLATVLLADVTDDLEAQRGMLRRMLQAEGVQVRPQGDYVGLTPPEFEAALAEDLARADLFVQLLSTTPGRKGRDFAAPLPQLQYDRALASRRPLMQWCERLPASGELGDAGHARLFQTEHLRVTNLADFSSGVIGHLRAARDRRRHANEVARAANGATASKPTAPRQRQVFLDDVAGEPALSDRLRGLIRQQDCGVRSLPPGMPLGGDGIDVKELLRPCMAGITIYTDPGKLAMAYNRLVYFLNQVAEGGLPLARWGVYLREGTVRSVFGIESDDVVPLDDTGLADFVRGSQS